MSASKPSLDELRIERGAQPDKPPRLLLIGAAVGIAAAMAVVFWWVTRPKAVEVRTAVARAAPVSASGERTVLNASGYVTARRAGDRLVQGHRQGDRGAGRGGHEGAGRPGPGPARRHQRRRRACSWPRRRRPPRGRRWPKPACACGRRSRTCSARPTSSRNKVAPQADFDHAEADDLALRARLEQQQADVTVAERTVAHLAAAAGRHDHPRAVRRHRHLEGRAARAR